MCDGDSGVSGLCLCCDRHGVSAIDCAADLWFFRIPKYESDGVTLSVFDICTIRLPSHQMFSVRILGSDYIELSGRYKSVKLPKRYAVLLCTYLLFIGSQLRRHVHCIQVSERP